MLNQPPLIEFEGVNVNITTDWAFLIVNRHPSKHINIAVQAHCRGFVQAHGKFGQAYPLVCLVIIEQDFPCCLLAVLPTTNDDEELLVGVPARNMQHGLDVRCIGAVQGKHMSPG